VADFASDDDVGRLIRRADDSLYFSKKAGRNCGHWNTGTNHVPITAPEEAIPPSLIEQGDAEEAAATAELAPQDDPPAAPTGATFIQLLKRRVTESHRFGIPISVMYIKVEEYEIIRRKYGGAIARQMVDAVAPAFQKVLREMDVMTKLENGEFVVMLPGSTRPEVSRVLKRMRAASTNCILPLVDHQLQIRFAHGVAELKPNETAQELLARARQAVAAAPGPQPAGN
jgi:diguanylate cyclase (GGDEF)-like protein